MDLILAKRDSLSCDAKSSGLSVIERIRSVEIQREVLTSFVPMGDFAGSHMNRRLVRGFRDDLKQIEIGTGRLNIIVVMVHRRY